MKKKPGRTRRFQDPFDYERHKGWQRTRGQAIYRNEPWELTIEDFFELWPQHRWLNRGLGVGNLVMSRRDPSMPWNRENTQIIPRLQQLREKSQRIKLNKTKVL
jgi:hypothetical protein